MSTAMSVAYFFIIELPGNVCLMALDFLRKSWNSHYH
jgi:hypothetical protein